MTDIYEGLTKGLYKIQPGLQQGVYEIFPEQIGSGVLLSELAQNVGNLQNGKADFSNTVAGFILGVDQGVAKFFIGDSTSYLNWDGSSLTISGALTATSGTIGGFSIGADYFRDAANSFGLASTVTAGDDVRFWAGDTFTNRATAPFRVTEAGAVTATNITITGGSVVGSTITAASIAGSQIQSATITGSNIASTTITAGNIANATITTTQISGTAGITGGQIASATITGGNIASTTITAGNITNLTITAAQIANLTITSGKVNTALMSYSHNLVFSVASSTQVNWATGTITTSDGTSYSISSGNTGTMAARTYIYLDTALSSTVLQTTTTFSTAVGDGKMLVATAQNNTTEAVFQVFNGIGGTNLAGGNVVASSITTNEIAANTIVAGNIAAATITGTQVAASTITASNLSVSTLSAITADLGSITAGNITLNTSGYIKGGQTAYNTGTGFFLGYSSAYKFSLGDSSTNYLIWDGTTLSVQGNILLGKSNITLAPGSDVLQAAINTLNSAGGGTLYLQAGTYTCTTAVTLYSNVSIVGAGENNTIVTFGSSAANFTMTGASVYTTGTISSISGGVNVVGSGTTWTSGMVGQQIFINNRWYVISARTDNTHITLATGYADGTTFSGTYRISSPIHDITISGLTLKLSTGTALTGTDVRDISLNGLLFLSNNKGFSLTNVMDISTNFVTVASSTSNGIEITNGSFINFVQTASVSNGGSGTVINTIKSSSFLFSASDSNTTDGYNCTSVTNTTFIVESSSNTSIGIQFVSGCNNNFLTNLITANNGSDGIKFTASSSNNTIGSGASITGNGGWGINIAASSDNNNVIVVPYFATNTSGNVQDLGTSTNQVLTSGSTALAALLKFGTGSDGSATLDGSATVSWASLAGSTYTLTRDINLINLTINTGIIVKTAGYAIYGQGTLTNNGTIQNDGGLGGAGGNGTSSAGGAAGTAGAATGAGTFVASKAGKAGAVGALRAPADIRSCLAGNNGTAGTAANPSLGTNGAAAGNGGDTNSAFFGVTSGGSGQSGGAATGETVKLTNTLFTLSSDTLTIDGVTSIAEKLTPTGSSSTTTLSTSAGSGSGGSGAADKPGDNGAWASGGGGGGSGASGGPLFLSFAIIINTSGTISSLGGNGGNGGNGAGSVGGDTNYAAGGGGGGGGGSGGVIFLVYSSFTGNAPSVAGGTKGTGGTKSAVSSTANNGSDGVVGNSGHFYKILIT